MFIMFGAFIISCGLTHIVAVITTAAPAYRLEGLVKVITAVVSWSTVIALIPIIPQALAMRMPQELEREIAQRTKAEEALKVRAQELDCLNKKLIENERLKGEFVANVSHELRTPLTLILAPLESLLSEKDQRDPETSRRLLETMHNNGVRLLQMVTQLLDLSKLEARKVEVHREPTHVANLTRSILSDFEASMGQRHITASFDEPVPPIPCVSMDRYLYERILFNLLSNALKFTSKGEVTISLSWRENRLKVSVEDTGCGIPEGRLQDLFQKFGQLEGSSTRRYEGTGLGLALVKEFAVLLEGNVSVESTVGKGSVFTVECRAPACDASAPVGRLDRPTTGRQIRYEAASNGEPEASKQDLPKILVVEDNRELASYICSTVREMGQTKVAPDGEEALRLASDWRPDIILSDVMMPRRDGLSLCREIKSNPATSKIPVVLLTALTRREALLKGWEAGADEYLMKPFHPEELVCRLKSMMATVQNRKLEEERSRLLMQQKEGERIEAARRHLAAIVDSSDDAIIGKTLDGIITSWNGGAERMFGYTAEEVIGQPMSVLIPPERINEEPRVLESLRRGEPIDRLETTRLRKDGSQVAVSVTISPIRDPGGRIVSAAAIARDVSEQKRSERMKDEFISTVSHELRTPLTSIYASLRLLSGSFATDMPAQARALVETACRNSERMTRLVSDILDVSKIAAGQITLDLKALEVKPLLIQAIKSNEVFAQEHKVRFVLKNVVAGTKIRGDSDRLLQVMTNLLSNAAKFSPPNDTVEVTVARSGPFVRVAVTDHGPGVPYEFQSRIFQRFAQANTSDSRVHTGSGLGLSIAKALVEKHGGRIGFETAPHVETTFYFDLPEWVPGSDDRQPKEALHEPTPEASRPG